MRGSNPHFYRVIRMQEDDPTEIMKKLEKFVGGRMKLEEIIRELIKSETEPLIKRIKELEQEVANLKLRTPIPYTSPIWPQPQPEITKPYITWESSTSNKATHTECKA